MYAVAADGRAPEAGAPEIEVTPAMITAGAELIAGTFDEPLDWLTRERASEIFLAMISRKAS
jgi:hypothetical protein